MRSIWTRSPVRCSPLWKRPTRTKRRRGARGARPSFKDAVARLADALAATVMAQGKLAQARNRLEAAARRTDTRGRSEEHTSEIQSLMRISYAVFCLKKKNQTNHNTKIITVQTH